MSESRPWVVAQVAAVLTRIVVEQDPLARAEWVDRRAWATLEEVQAGAAVAFAGTRELLAEYDRLRQVDVDSGLDDWAFLYSIGVAS